jgi:hypothetical protein
MDPNRSTVTPSALGWLNVIQRGGTADWKRLYEQCRDPAQARAVAQTLAWRDPDLMPSARLWKFLLEDLHPNLELRIDLREHQSHVGV